MCIESYLCHTYNLQSMQKSHHASAEFYLHCNPSLAQPALPAMQSQGITQESFPALSKSGCHHSAQGIQGSF